MAKLKKPLAAAFGAAFIASAAAPLVSAETNPFSVQQLSGGYDLVNYAGHKEGGCGADAEGDKAGGEGSCGEGHKADGEGSCGGGDKAEGEGSCGEGHGAEGEKAEGEGKCGEGKCGGS